MNFEIDENGRLTSCLGDDVIVRIPEGVKKIGIFAFRGREHKHGRDWYIPNMTMEEVILPASCEEIEDGAFSDCRTLRRIRFTGNTPKRIGGAFFRCDSLDKIDLPEGVTEIGADAFSNLKSLRDIVLPKSLKWLGPRAFLFTEVEHIYYRGTKEEFDAADLEGGFNEANRDKVIYGYTLPLEAPAD